MQDGGNQNKVLTIQTTRYTVSGALTVTHSHVLTVFIEFLLLLPLPFFFFLNRHGKCAPSSDGGQNFTVDRPTETLRSSDVMGQTSTSDTAVLWRCAVSGSLYGLYQINQRLIMSASGILPVVGKYDQFTIFLS